MKNKKLLTRLFALLASLVLVFALALPCFADTVESDPLIVKTISFSDYASLYDWYSVNKAKVFEVRFNNMLLTQIDDYGNELQFVGTYVWSLEGDAKVFEGQTSRIFVNFNDYSITEYYFYDRVSDSSQNFSFGTSYLASDDITKMVFYYYDVAEFGPEEPNETGWYSQIKNIIKDAVFGESTVLNDSQEFTINQISLWLTLAVILLPLIVVGAILVRCFR